MHRVYTSLVTQTFTDFEWIIIDDGSTDNTREQVMQWQKDVSFCIHYFYQENGGKTSALVSAIPKAVGELILIADSDDAFLPQSLEAFNAAWQALLPDQRQHCSGIYALCQTQTGAHVGENYASEGLFDPMLFHFGGEIAVPLSGWGPAKALVFMMCQMLQNGIYLCDLTIGQCLALNFSGSETEKIGFVSIMR